MTLPGQRTILAGTLVLLLGTLGIVALNPWQAPGPASLIDRCEAKEGEWLYNSERRVCILGDGTWLEYSLAEDDFVNPNVSVPVVLAAEPVPTVGDAWSDDVDTCDHVPTFEEYPALSMYSGPVAAADFATNEAAQHHRTAIRKDMIGVNFGGEYVFAYWGCGEGCKGSAVVNAESGEILTYGLQAAGYDFRRDSRLLIASGDEYYVVENNQFKQLCE